MTLGCNLGFKIYTNSGDVSSEKQHRHAPYSKFGSCPKMLNQVPNKLKEITNTVNFPNAVKQEVKIPPTFTKPGNSIRQTEEEAMDSSLISSGILVENRLSDDSHVMVTRDKSNNTKSNTPAWRTARNTLLPAMNRTPPMCACGRRTHRKFVQSPGPNMGRAFYCCPNGRKGTGQRSGCAFFKWDVAKSCSGSYASPVLRTVSGVKPSTDISSLYRFPLTGIPAQPNFITPNVSGAEYT